MFNETDDTNNPLTKEKENQIDAIFAKHYNSNTLGCAVGVIQSGKFTYEKSLHRANLWYKKTFLIFILLFNLKAYATDSLFISADNEKSLRKSKDDQIIPAFDCEKTPRKNIVLEEHFIETFQSDFRDRGWQCNNIELLKFDQEGLTLQQNNDKTQCSIAVVFKTSMPRTFYFRCKNSKGVPLFILDGKEYHLNRTKIASRYRDISDSLTYQFSVDSGLHKAQFVLKSKTNYLKWAGLTSIEAPIITAEDDSWYKNRKNITLSSTEGKDSILYYTTESYEGIININQFKPYNNTFRLYATDYRDGGFPAHLNLYAATNIKGEWSKIANYTFVEPSTYTPPYFSDIINSQYSAIIGINQTNKTTGSSLHLSVSSFYLKAESHYFLDNNRIGGAFCGGFHLSGITKFFIKVIGLNGKSVDRPIFILPGILFLPFVTSKIEACHKFNGEDFYRWQTDLPINDMIGSNRGIKFLTEPFIFNLFLRYEKGFDKSEELLFGVEAAYKIITKYNKKNLFDL